MRSLNLWKKNLTEVPASVWETPGLESLILADNQITVLPDGIGELSRLRTLRSTASVARLARLR